MAAYTTALSKHCPVSTASKQRIMDNNPTLPPTADSGPNLIVPEARIARRVFAGKALIRGKRTYSLRPVLAERGRREARRRSQERGRLRQAAHGCDRPPARDQRVRTRPRHRCGRNRRYRRQQAHLLGNTTAMLISEFLLRLWQPHVQQQSKLVQL